MPKQMLNVGLHFDRCTKETGGLVLIPGTHKQSFMRMAFGKICYDDRPDPRERDVETEPGDLTIHDGRLWHRVQRSPFFGEKSLRRSMYVPYLTDAYQPKDENRREVRGVESSRIGHVSTGPAEMLLPPLTGPFKHRQALHSYR
jgi:hypothetical protein